MNIKNGINAKRKLTQFQNWLTERIDDQCLWFRLRQLGKSKTIKSSYFWLFFTPLAAKVLAPLPEQVNIEFLGESFPANVTLPLRYGQMLWMVL